MHGESEFLIPASPSVLRVASCDYGQGRRAVTYHRGVWPPRLSVSVFFASLPSRAAQYGFCLPMVFLLGKFLARSTMTISVPISGPSTVMSEKIPAVCMAFIGPGPDGATLVDMRAVLLPWSCDRAGSSCGVVGAAVQVPRRC